MLFVYKQCFIQYQAKTDGSPATGYVEFTPNSVLMDADSSVIFNDKAISKYLDATGKVEVELLANDSDNITPDNWSWVIEEKIEGGGLWWFQITQDMPEPIDLRTLYPLGDAPPTIVDPGTPGTPGAPGTPGTPGTPGAAATVDVGTTATGAPNTDAEVTNVGTSSAAVFDFTLPRGDTGDANAPHIGDDEPVDPAVVEWFDTSEPSVRGVLKSGDTMTGPLILPDGGPAVSSNYADPVYLYAEAQVQMYGEEEAVLQSYTPATVALPAGKWLVQAGILLKQDVSVDTCWVCVADTGTGQVPNSVGAGTVLDVYEFESVMSAPVLVDGGRSYCPAWYVHGVSRCDVDATDLGPAAFISAVRLSGATT